MFFPGPAGYADYEQNFVPLGSQPDTSSVDYARINSPLELEAEWMAFAAAGGSSAAGASIGALGGVPLPAGFNLPFGQINLGGIILDIYGPGGPNGVKTVLAQAAKYGENNSPNNGQSVKVDPGGDLYLAGTDPPTGWIIAPHSSPDDSSPLTAAEVAQIIDQGINTASQTRAQIRLPYGSAASMTLAVSDKNGNILGLYRMPDSTVFSTDVAFTKARNTAYYDNPAEVQGVDLLPGYAPGVALNAQTFRYLALPNFPTGAPGSPPGPFSILNAPGINPTNGENLGPALPASVYSNGTNILAHDAFVPASNFHATANPQNQSGVVFFPGSTPVYIGGAIAGGLGVSGDGVDQDNVVTYYASQGYSVPPNVVEADQTFYEGVRLPFYVFSRNSLEL